jgi:two-component system, NtrC family, response regulator GlrR
MSSEARKARLLVVDDDPSVRKAVTLRLELEGYAVTAADSAEKALGFLAVSRPHLVLTDLKMGGMDGMALFEAIAKDYPALPVIIMTAHGTVPDAVSATRRGVFGYLTKPFESAELLREIERGLTLSGNTLPMLAVPADEAWRRDIITRSAAMEAILAEAKLVATTDATVFIQGESGTGKEVLAQAIHAASGRRDGQFVAINCGAIPEQLLESELFGHVKGSFTGAQRDHRGLFQSAEAGTLFLDEIGDMPVPLQVKLLRALQERQVRPVGSTQSVPINVRVISATHRDLEAAIAEGGFREDLYYRLNVVAFTLPPLAERREDIPMLANHFLGQIAKKYSREIRGFAAEGVEMLMAANWPGNVRQLYNVVEKVVALCTESMVPSVLVQRAINRQTEEFVPLDDAKKRFEREYLVQLLKLTKGNVTSAAKLAKRNRSEFYSLLHRHELDPGLFKSV